MKLQELLTERHEYEDIIRSTAKALTRTIIDKILKDELPTFADKYGTGQLGKIKQLIDTNILKQLYTRLRNINVWVDYSSSSEFGGMYDRYGNTSEISINIYDLTNYITNHVKDLSDVNYNSTVISTFISSLVHELKHALDDSLSKRRVSGSSRDLMRSHKYASGEDKYLIRQTEINARISQAANDIANQVKGQHISNEQLMDSIILPTLKKYQLTQIFTDTSGHPMRGIYQIFGREIRNRSSYPMGNKFFRKLLGRMYSYARNFS